MSEYIEREKAIDKKDKVILKERCSQGRVEMTPQKAIEILQGERDYDRLHSYVNTALELAISALEKQIPKKTTNVYAEFLSSKNICVLGEFPRCRMGVQVNFRYCKDCGQALDWSSGE